MTRIAKLLAAAMLCCGLASGCSESSGSVEVGGSDPVASAPPPHEAGDVKAIVEASNAFALSGLYAELATQPGNVFFSPASIHTALAMTYAGARGETEAQMAAALRLPDWEQARVHAAYAALLDQFKPKRAPYELHVTNRLWGQPGFAWQQPFVDVTRSHYGAGLREVDFAADADAARQTINAWIDKQTRGKITDLIPAGTLDSMTRLVLTNAIYFKSKWDLPFEPDVTRDAPFHISPDEQVQVPMMHQTEPFGYAETDLAQVLSMSYARGELAMVVILPRAIDGLPAVEAALIESGLDDIELTDREVRVSFPRYRIEQTMPLRDTLAALGMTDAFDADRADFTGMTTREPLFIAAALHKAFVDVTEEGTEAAAATAIGAKAASDKGGDPPPVFRADHPFVFLIRHTETGTILFLGRVTDPRG